MLNSELTLELAHKWAERLVAEHPDSTDELITAAYRAAFSRMPTKKEITLSEQFLADEAKSESKDAGKLNANTVAAFCHALFNTNEFITVD